MKFEVIIADYLNEKHGSDIVHLLNCYAQDPMGGSNSLSSFTQENLVSKLAELPSAFSLICYVDNQPAGLVNCFMGFSTFSCQPLVNIHDVVVIDKFRGLGISQIMLTKVENIATEKGCCKITLEVLEGNVAAKKAYLKHGFAAYELDPEMGKALFWQKNIENNE